MRAVCRLPSAPIGRCINAVLTAIYEAAAAICTCIYNWTCTAVLPTHPSPPPPLLSVPSSLGSCLLASVACCRPTGARSPLPCSVLLLQDGCWGLLLTATLCCRVLQIGRCISAICEAITNCVSAIFSFFYENICAPVPKCGLFHPLGLCS
jgi:hypothetical protein